MKPVLFLTVGAAVGFGAVWLWRTRRQQQRMAEAVKTNRVIGVPR